MATKMKKISISQMDKVMKNLSNTEAAFEWNGITVVVKTLLSFQEMMEFAGRVKANCFVEGEYLPEVRDFAIRDCIVDMYSNIRLPDNIEHKYEILYRTDICQEIVKYINPEQYEQLLVAIDDKVTAASESNTEELRLRIEEIAHELDNMVTEAGALFDGIDKSDIETIFEAVKSSGRIDEEKIARAYMDAANERRETESVNQGEPVVKD